MGEEKKIEERKCSCNSFEGRETPAENILHNFNIITRSQPKEYFDKREGEYTSLIQCPKCSSYYITNVYGSIFPNQRTLLINKCNSELKAALLINTVKLLEGIVENKDLDECFGMRSTMTRILSEKRNNENKN